MKKIFLFLLCIVPSALFAAKGASLFIAPTTVRVNQKMGASLMLYNYTSDSGASIYVRDIQPLVYTTTPSSSGGSVGFRVPHSFSKPFLGPGGVTTISPFGASVIYNFDARFFAPSVFPAYSSGGSFVAVGTQTYSVGMQAFFTDGSSVLAVPQRLTVLPISLPASQQ